MDNLDSSFLIFRTPKMMTAETQRVGLTGARFGRGSRRPEAEARLEATPSEDPTNGRISPGNIVR